MLLNVNEHKKLITKWFNEYNDFQNPRFVVVVSVCKFPGGVFTATPDSFYVNTRNQEVKCWSFDQWRKAMLNPFRGDILFL